MGEDSLAENTLYATEFICPICLLKPKSFGFQWKKASSVVRGSLAAENDDYLQYWGQNRFSNRIRKKKIHD